MARSKWNVVTLAELASHFDTRAEFIRHEFYAASKARELGMLDDLFPRLPRGPRPTIWNEHTISEAAAPYRKRSTFARNARAAYNAAVRLGLLDTLFPKKPTVPDWLK